MHILNQTVFVSFYLTHPYHFFYFKPNAHYKSKFISLYLKHAQNTPVFILNGEYEDYGGKWTELP